MASAAMAAATVPAASAGLAPHVSQGLLSRSSSTFPSSASSSSSALCFSPLTSSSSLRSSRPSTIPSSQSLSSHNWVPPCGRSACQLRIRRRPVASRQYPRSVLSAAKAVTKSSEGLFVGGGDKWAARRRFPTQRHTSRSKGSNFTSITTGGPLRLFTLVRASAADDERFTSLATNPLGGISRLMDAGRSNLSSLFQFVLATSFVRAVLDSGLRLWQATGEKLVEDVDLKSDLEAEGGVIDTSRQLWNEAVVKVKEGAAKTQEYIREKAVELKPHYEETAERTRLVIAQSTEEMKRQAEKAKEVIVSTAKVVAEQGKEGLAQVVESTPQPIKEIAEVAVTAHSSERSKSGAAIHDFCLGIPYGTVLVAGGIFWFIVVGSTNALRFGVGLGGILLASSILSLRAWKAARSSTPFIATSQVISLAIAITEWRRFAVTRAVFPTFFTALFSLGMAVFYAYILLAGGNPPKKSHADATPAPSVSSVVEAPST
ncbi:hypothetical protein CBR_g47126 [Chara braunii]|uniref:Uncharacterized protein n=1 Tax=Chara braunii TaxID=69332 RepID=A0A388M1G7_CHABU|nr:hypothetical protein CBR_g47126 [Chara braunii]|eukprot:GBG88428.1 hypothetical protein CBR_g47126 [Chara braunii]